MTPKEKAKELVERFIPFSMDNHIEKYAIHIGKQCALICVDEIIKEYTTLPHFGELYEENIEYWNKVKQEIERI